MRTRLQHQQLQRCLVAWSRLLLLRRLQLAQAASQHEQQLMWRALLGWAEEFMPHARAQRLLLDAQASVVEDLCWQRERQLLGSCIQAWRALAADAADRQLAAAGLLRSAALRGRLGSWMQAAHGRRQQRLAWWQERWAAQQAEEAQAREAAAGQLCRQALLGRALRAWLEAWGK